MESKLTQLNPEKQFDKVFQEKLQEAEKRPIEPVYTLCDHHVDVSFSTQFDEIRDKYKILTQYFNDTEARLQKTEEEEQNKIAQIKNDAPTFSNLTTLLEEYCAIIQQQSAIKGAKMGINWKRASAAVLFEQEILKYKQYMLLTEPE